MLDYRHIDSAGCKGNRVRLLAIIIIAFLLSSPSSFALAAQDGFDDQVPKALTHLKQAYSKFHQLMVDGDYDGAVATMLDTFPVTTRTAAQSFVLGNSLFEISPKHSYNLHKAAAAAEPQKAEVNLEWAKEQHRAGEFAGALESYERYSRGLPRWDLAFVLQTDCLLHLHRYNDAVAVWPLAILADRRIFPMVEEMISTVKHQPFPFQRRAELLAQVTKKKDGSAAAELIALDCCFPFGVNGRCRYEEFLKHDAPIVADALQLRDDDVLGRSMACATEIVLTHREDVRDVLVKHRLLVDENHTLPSLGKLLSFILNSALDDRAIDEATICEEIAPKVLARARQGNDAATWNVGLELATRGTEFMTHVARAKAGGDNLPRICIPDMTLEERVQLHRDAWKATADPWFASSLLSCRFFVDLTGNDPELEAAIRQFPNDGNILRIAYGVAAKEGRVTQELLASATRAEFKQFTSPNAFGTAIGNPNLDQLVQYMKQLKEMADAN